MRAFFANEDPIGKHVTVWFAKTMIVGVVSDFKLNALDRKTLPEIFWSTRQIPSSNVWIRARANSAPSILAESMRQKIHDFDPDLPVLDVQSMDEVVSDFLWLKRLSATLIGLVAVLAILLAGAGIHSVMSYSVSQRKKEMGIRVAFGAGRRDVLGLVMGETCRLAILGSVLGCIAAFYCRQVGDAYGVSLARAGIESISGEHESSRVHRQFSVPLWDSSLCQLCPGEARAEGRSDGCIAARIILLPEAMRQ